MLHHHRRFAVTVVPSLEEIAEKLTEHTWTGCTCFAYQELLLANDKQNLQSSRQNSRPSKQIDRSCLSLGSQPFHLKLSRCC
jgi:hypothetical protein